MSDDTPAGITEEIEPATTEVAYAWGAEAAEDFTVPADQVDEPATGAPILAVAVLAGVALAVAAVAAVVVLVTPTRTDHYDLRPMPVQAAPEPPKAAPAPAPVAAPPVAAPAPVIVQPPVAAPVQRPPVAAPPADANQQFSRQLAQGKMWQHTPDDDQQARRLCADLAAGGNVQPYIDGTERKSPQLLPQEAAQVVHDAIESYCPQYDR
jgi:hypothetical protein